MDTAMYTNPPKNMYTKIGVGRGKIGLLFPGFSELFKKIISFHLKIIFEKIFSRNFLALLCTY
jgi:hypothetical protein